MRQDSIQNSYFYAYTIKALHRRSCFQCQYRYEQRIEDITIGDFWKIERFHPNMPIREGISSLLINSKKGRELFEAIKPTLLIVPTKIEDIAYWNNITLGNAQTKFKMPSSRSALFKTISTKGWKAAERKYLAMGRRKEVIKMRIPRRCYKILKKGNELIKGKR